MVVYRVFSRDVNSKIGSRNVKYLYNLNRSSIVVKWGIWFSYFKKINY